MERWCNWSRNVKLPRGLDGKTNIISAANGIIFGEAHIKRHLDISFCVMCGVQEVGWSIKAKQK